MENIIPRRIPEVDIISQWLHSIKDITQGCINNILQNTKLVKTSKYSLNNWNMPKNISTENKNGIEENLNNMLRIFSKNSYSFLNEHSIENLWVLCEKIFLWEKPELILNTWIWGVKSEASVCLPTYILGSINILKDLKEGGADVKLRIHSWFSEAVNFNNYWTEICFYYSMLNFYLLKRFIQKYYPDLESCIFFDLIDIQEDELKKIEDIEKYLLMNSWENENVMKLIETFRKMGRKYGWEDWENNSLKYAISHSFWLLDLKFIKNISSEKTSWNTPFFISLWWKAEQNFNLLRDLIENSKETLWLSEDDFNKTIKFTTEVYHKPPYYKDEKWDLWFLDSFTTEDLSKLSSERQEQLKILIDSLWIDSREYIEFLSETKQGLDWNFDNMLMTLWENFLKFNKSLTVDTQGNVGKNRLLFDNNNNESVKQFLSKLEKDIRNRWFLPHDFEEKKDSINWRLELMKWNCEEIIWEDGLLEKISTWKDLIVKYWIDPTWDEIHLGHLIPIKKLFLFQKLGYTIKFLIWTFTATIGDPDKKSIRPMLSEEQIQVNIQTYLAQIWKVIDLNNPKVQVVYNKDWYGKWTWMDMLKLANKWRLARMMERRNFRERFDEWKSIAIGELIYPLLQWWDSVVLNADIELGGSDQRFNMFMWRDLQVLEEQTPQTVITSSLLNGFDGRKMSKTFDNYVWIRPEIDLQKKVNNDYWKLMSMSDKSMLDYFRFVVSTSEEELFSIKELIHSGKINPMILKKLLARCILSLFYSENEIIDAEGFFTKTVSNKDIPEDITTLNFSCTDIFWKSVIEIISSIDKEQSNSNIRRLIKAWAVYVNNEKINDEKYTFGSIENPQEIIIKYWKRKFIKVILI